jgi:arylsulfatase A
MKIALFLLLLTSLTFAAERPNFIVIVADDLGYADLGVTGHPKIKTPHLDALAQNGAIFNHFYSGAQVCSPSRAAMMTGKMPHRSGIYSFIGGSSGNLTHIPKFIATLPQILREAGYQTALVGKWHNSLNQVQANNKNIPSMDHYGFDYWFSSDDNSKILNKPNWLRNGKNEGTKKGYSANIVGMEAIHWLKDLRDPKKPFIQFIHFYEPHWRIEAPLKLVNQYLTSATDNKNEAIYFGAVSNVDLEIGNIMKTLKKLGIAENTAVFFTSDHGPAKLGKGKSFRNYGSAAPYRGNKYGLWEGSIHVPGIVNWPSKIKAGLKIDTPAGGIDWLPTICEISGTALPEGLVLDGQSHLPLLLGKKMVRKKPLQWHHYNTNFKNSPNPNAVMRRGDYVICGFYDPQTQFKKSSWKEAHIEQVKTGKLIRFTLYNIIKDPKQQNDRSQKEKVLFVKLKGQLQDAHAEMQKQAVGWKADQPVK